MTLKTVSTLKASLPSQPYLFLPPGWDATWKAAVAAQSTTPAWIAYIGDSITAGQGATDAFSTSWLSLHRTFLKTKYPLYADFYPLWPYTTTSATANLFPNGTPWSALANGAVTGTFSFAYGKIPVTGTTTSLDMWTFTTPYACAQIEIIYVDQRPGSFQYKVDGGGAVTVTMTSGSQSNTTALVKKATITGLSNTTHTVVITNQSAVQVAQIMGASTYASTTTGVGYMRSGHNGIQLADLALASQAPPDKIKLWQGVTAAGAATGFGFPMAPHGAIIELGVNDLGAAQTTAQFQANASRLIHALRRGQDGCSIAFLAVADVDGTSSDLSNAAGLNWYQMKLAMKQMADTYGCAFIDVDSKWGETTVGKGFQTSDVHPTDAGHADIATLLQQVFA